MVKILVLDDFDDFSEFEHKVKTVSPEAEIVYAINEAGDLDETKMNTNLADADILVVGPFNKKIMDTAKNLKWVHCTSAGVNRLLFPEFINSPVTLTNARGIHPIPIAEHVFAAILCFQRRFIEHIKNQTRKEWVYNRSEELYGKTIGIIGLGKIGKRVAEIGKAFGCRVIGVKRTYSNEKIENIDEIYTLANIDSVLQKSDYVVLCLPSTPKTENLFDASKFKKMKPPAILINIGRGNVIRDDDLIQALKEKIIAGAALDVFREEPLPMDSPYYNLDNALITPHHSGSTLKYDERSIDIFCENLKSFIKGMELPTTVDKNEGY